MVSKDRVRSAIQVLKNVVCEAEGIGSNSADRLFAQIAEIEDELMEYAG